MKVKIRAYRAIDNKESCQKYADGHTNVLLHHGVTKVTSASIDWIDNPNVYVVQAESSDNKVLGGARVHIFNDQFPLPIENAVKEYDPNILEMLRKHAKTGTGELCGLWNSKEVTGLGIATQFLMRAGISITNQLKLTSLFALCAQHTLFISTSKGFIIEHSLGKDGTFYYPKDDLLATAIIIKDPEILSAALPEEREAVFDLRKNPQLIINEIKSDIKLEIEYNLLIL